MVRSLDDSMAQCFNQPPGLLQVLGVEAFGEPESRDWWLGTGD